MTSNAWLPLLVLASSLVPGLIIFTLPEKAVALRITLNLGGALLKIILLVLMMIGVFHGVDYEVSIPLVPGIDFRLHADALSLMFVNLSAVLWLATTVYAIGYLEDSPNRSRFFGYFSLCVTTTVGLAMAGNLLTFLVFYEALTLTTYPLVVHRGTEEARKAGRTYLAYTLFGGVLVLAGTIWLYSLTGTLEFVDRGFVSELGLDPRGAAHHLCPADPRRRREGGAGAHACLAADRHGRTGAGERAAARGGRGEGRRLRHRAHRV